MQLPAPLSLPHRQIVESAWIDYNGHMNVAYYGLAFDRAYDQLLEWLGIDEGYRDRTGCSTFTLESHFCYLQELKVGEPLGFTMWLIDRDQKRLHLYAEMRQAERGFVAASHEWAALHVDLEVRRGVPMPTPVLERLERWAAAHAAIAKPERVGRIIGLGRR
jgi:acyl-CoA thioester hydrolase